MSKSSINSKKGSFESLLANDKFPNALVKFLAQEGCNEFPFHFEDKELNNDVLEEITKEVIDLLKNPDSLAYLIENEPFILMPSVMISIHVLRCIAGIDDQETADWGKNYLKKLGLSGFLPGRSKNTTKSKTFSAMKQNPEILTKLVEGWRVSLLKLFDNCPNNCKRSRRAKLVLKPRGGSIVNECCIEHVFNLKINEDFPEDFFDFELKDMTALTLRIISYKYEVPYSSLYKFYYQINKS